jgi:hypothetical protein
MSHTWLCISYSCGRGGCSTLPKRSGIDTTALSGGCADHHRAAARMGRAGSVSWPDASTRPVREGKVLSGRTGTFRCYREPMSGPRRSESGWRAGSTISDFAREQNVELVDGLGEFAADFWESDAELEAFLADSGVSGSMTATRPDLQTDRGQHTSFSNSAVGADHRQPAARPRADQA